MDIMNTKVEIQGMDTSKLPKLSAKEQMEMLRKIKEGDLNLKDDELKEYIINNLIRPNHLSFVDMKKISEIKYKDYTGFIYKKKFKNLILYINKEYGKKLIKFRYVISE